MECRFKSTQLPQMANKVIMSSSASSTCSHTDPRIKMTFDVVNWDTLSSLACKHFQVDSSHWGAQKSGGYNLIRFLHLHDSQNTTLIARVPLRDEEGLDTSIPKRIESEVATMEYAERYTNIPLPHVCHYSVDAGGDVRSPYILMTKVEGTPLASVWDDMDDEKRRIVLRQVIGVLLELWSHRFDKVGALFKRPERGGGKDPWYIESSTVLKNPTDTIECQYNLLTTSFPHAADYWLAYSNAYLRNECETRFGYKAKEYSYAHGWFMRSLVPALFDPSNDAHGHPLTHGDFHSQNIMFTDLDTHPRLSAVIDWEFSGTEYVSTFGQYPFFIVDHPWWDEDHPLRERNVRDQATFDEILFEEERTSARVGGAPLSRLISESYGVYLFQQVMQFPREMYAPLFPLLVKHVLGEYGDFSYSYFDALLENGILKKELTRFDQEAEAFLEARRVLGEEKVKMLIKLVEFKDLVAKDLERFNEGSVVREWLASVT